MKSIFISSTFRDMQAERDLLHRVVFPGLRGRLARQGEDIQEMDLRWGVDTSDLSEESSNIMVMKTCIDAIDRCLPYMVVFLGERYGWIPERSMVEETHDSRLAAWEGDAISITQMEILYGALEDGRHLEKCIFCFRDEHFTRNMPEGERRDYEAESEVHRSKLRLLKERIRRTPGARILEYTPVWDEAAHRVSGLDDLAARLGECLWEMIREEDKEEGREPREEKTLKNARLTAERYLKSYIDIEKLDGSTFKRRNYGVFLVGEGGSGKSAMGTRITDYCERMGDHVFRYYCGNEGCADIDTFLDVLLYWEAKDRGREIENPEREGKNRGQESENRGQRSRDHGSGRETPAREPQASGAGSTEEKQILLWERLREKTTYDRVFFIDGAEEMPAGFLKVIQGLANALSNQFGHRMLLVTSRPEPVRYLREAAEKAGEQEKEIFDFTDLDWFHKTYPIGEKEIRAIADRHAALRGKQLDSMVLQQICRHPLSGNLFSLTMILQRLFMMDKDDFARAEQLAPGMEGLSLYMQQMVRELPTDQGGLAACVVRRAAEQLAHCGGSFALEGRTLADAQEVLMLLAASREGLSVSELNRILEMENAFYPPLLLEQLFCYLYDCFAEEESGRWNFRHRFLRESILQSADRAELEKTYRKLLSCYQANTRTGDWYGEEFYYIWRCGDVPAAVSLLERTGGRQPDEVLSTVFFQMLRQAQESGDEFARVLYPKLTPGAQETANRILLNSGEKLFAHVWILRGYYRGKNAGKEGTPQQRLWQLLVALKLEETETEVREENQVLWKRMVRAFFECDAIEPWILPEIYEAALFQAFFGDIIFFTEESGKLCESLAKLLRDADLAAMAQDTERLLAWGERRTRLAQGSGGEQSREMMSACENMLRAWKDTCDPKLYHMALYRMTGSYANARKYAAAAPLYREVIRFAEEGFGATRSLFCGRLCMLAEAGLAGCLKKEFRQDHYLRAQKMAEELAVQFSSPFTQYYLAAMCDVMYFGEKQLSKESANERIAKWEHAGDYLVEGFGALECVAEYMLPEEIPVCLMDRKLLLLEDRVEWQEQMGSWTAGQSMKEDFESIWSGCEALFARTKDERYRQKQLAGIASALEYYGRWRDSEGVCLWAERLQAVIGVDGKENSVNEGKRYQTLLCRLPAAESMLRCGKVEESDLLSAACRKDARLLAEWPGLEQRQEEWERVQIRLLLLDGEIACRRAACGDPKEESTESHAKTDDPKKESTESLAKTDDPKEDTISSWLPVALQAYRRAEKLCEQTTRQIEEERGKKQYVGSSRRNALIMEQFGLWIRAALLLADGYRQMGETEKEDSCLARVKDAELFLAEPGSSERISLTELGERGIWLRLEYARLAMRTPHLSRALSALASIGKKHIPDSDLRLWPELYDMALKLMRLYGKPGHDDRQKQELGLLMLRTLWEQAGSGQATDEEKQMLAGVLAGSYRDDDTGYDIPLVTYTSKRYDREKRMKDIRKIQGPFPWPNSFICNREWHENVFRYAQKYGKPEDCCLAAMRLSVCFGLDGDCAKAYELCRTAGAGRFERDVETGLYSGSGKAAETGLYSGSGKAAETSGISEQFQKLCRCWEILWELLEKRAWELPEAEKWRGAWEEARRIREEHRQWMKKENITFDTAMDMVLYATGTYLQCDIEWEELQNFLKNIDGKPVRYWLGEKSGQTRLAMLLRVPAEKMLETNRIRLEQASTREERMQRQRELRISCNVLRYLWSCETEEATGRNEWQRDGEIYRYKKMAAELTWEIEGSRYGIREKIHALYQYLGADQPISPMATAEDVKHLLPDYHELVQLRAQSDAGEWEDKYGLRNDWNYLNFVAEKIFLYLYEQEQDVQWLWMLFQEYQEMHRCLSEKATETWKAQHITYNYTDVRYIWLKLARHLPEEEWAKPYLKTVEDQLAHIGKNRRILASAIEKLSGDLNMELRGLKLETPALQTELRTLVAAMPALLSGAGHDISYIMMKAVEELGPDASEDQIRQYVEARM